MFYCGYLEVLGYNYMISQGVFHSKGVSFCSVEIDLHFTVLLDMSVILSHESQRSAVANKVAKFSVH